ncbi:MAG: acetoacetate--CoA ligase [Candidatus Kapabacteria bacterium]|nr:acetoacetate--CoA ligase [Candidatus Kapabacteria bacterium]
MQSAQPLWYPSPDQIKNSNMTKFMNFVNVKFDLNFLDYYNLYDWSIDRIEDFWVAIWEFSEIIYSKSYKTVLDDRKMPGSKWFQGAELNFAENLLKYRDDRIALIYNNEKNERISLSYRELYAQVAECAAGLKKLGVRKCDRVAALISNIPEAIIAMLATTSIGAVWSSTSPDFGLSGILDRFEQINPKVLFAVNGYTYNGTDFDCSEKIEGICSQIISLEKIVIIPKIQSTIENLIPVNSENAGIINCESSVIPANSGISFHSTIGDSCIRECVKTRNNNVSVIPAHAGIPFQYQSGDSCIRRNDNGEVTNDTEDMDSKSKFIFWNDFIDKNAVEIEFEQLPFDHPVYIMYSSGTTGVPKCIVHGAGGTLLQHFKELSLHTNLTRDDVITYFTTCGWMMWNWLVSSLNSGATIFLFDGSPSYPNINILWKTIEVEKITIFGTSPKFLSTCQKSGIKPGREFDLSSLKTILSTGSPLSSDEFQWVYSDVKTDIRLSSISGGTDIISCFMLGNPNLPVYSGEIQCRGLGMKVESYDENADGIIDVKGELVCTAPFISMPVYFWNDPENKLYFNSYFNVFTDVWCHGDFIKITDRGGVIVYGRSDATLNPGGVRIGSAEIYRVIESIEEINDSIVVGVNHDNDIRIVLFVVTKLDINLTNELIVKIKSKIRVMLTPRHVPYIIKAINQVPVTFNGKKVELAVTKILNGEQVKNLSAIANPESLAQFVDIISFPT